MEQHNNEFEDKEKPFGNSFEMEMEEIIKKDKCPKKKLIICSIILLQ